MSRRPTPGQGVLVAFGNLLGESFHHNVAYVENEGDSDAKLVQIDTWTGDNRAFHDNAYIAGENIVRRFLRSPGNRVVFARSARRLDRLGVARPRVLVFGHRDSARLRRACARRGVAIERMEDGFLRSVGLGSNVTVPASLVVDRRGLYYDPTTESDLEHLLQEHVFSEDELGAARALRGRLVAAGLSKYNVGRRAGVVVPRGRPVVLVPGQVEGDASVRLGCVDVRTNGALLAAVRAVAPGAHILFKPHPDVVAGNRRGLVPAVG